MNRLWTAVWCAAVVCLSACNCAPTPPTEDAGTGGSGGGTTGGGGGTTGGGGGTMGGGGGTMGGGGGTMGGGGGTTGGGGGTTGGGGGTTGGGGGGTTGGGGGDLDAGMPELFVEPQSLILAVAEGGQASMPVRLTAAPGAPVTVTIVSSDDLAAGATPTTLTFTAADWNVAQQVTVSGVEDQDLAPASADLTLSAPGMAPVVMAVDVTDDDTQAVVLAPGGTVQVNENGTATVTAALAFAPASTVTVSASTGDPAVAAVTPPSVSFSPANYATPQTLTLTGTDDADAADGTTTLTVSGPGLTPGTLTVEVNDDDALGIAFGVMNTTIPENGGGFVPVRLTAQPAAMVTVTFVSSDPGSLTVTTATLQFTPQNWSTPQNLFLGGVTDDDVADENVVVTASAPALADRTLQVTVDDPDVVSVVVSPALNVTEFSSSPLAVRLSHRPSSSVVVTLVADDATRLLLVPPSLTFTPVNALVDQLVTVNALPDDDADPEQLSITTSLAGNDKFTVVNVTDDDTQALFVPQTTVAVTEGNTTTFAVRLAYRPAVNVTVTVQSLDTTRVSVMTSVLTFTPSNYATSQNVSISGTQDTNLVNESATVRVASTGLPSVDVTVNVTDDDTQAIVPSVSMVTINEGSTQLVGVRLAFQPFSSVTVTGSIPGAADAHVVNVGGVTFTTANWSIPQSIEVAVDRDLDRVTAPTTLTFSSTITPQVAIPLTPVERTLALGFTTVAPASTTLADGTVYAYPITVPAGEYVFGYGVIAAAGGGQLQFALYTDAGGVPGNLVSLTSFLTPMPVPFAGTNEREFSLGNSLAGGTYWIAYRGASSVQLRSGGTPLVSRCVRAAGIPDINAPWPATFGSTTCALTGPTNVYAITWH